MASFILGLHIVTRHSFFNKIQNPMHDGMEMYIRF